MWKAMFRGVQTPILRFALPLQSETHWSDLLAILIATDPVRLVLRSGAVIARRCR
jgi:hypothetical protein